MGWSREYQSCWFESLTLSADVYYDVDEEGEIIISEVSNEDGDVWTEDELDEDDPDLLEEILDYLEDMLDLDIEDLYSSSK